MLIVSVAAGVCSTFGACYGGLMFSIEICTSSFLVTNLWKAFVCSVIVKVIYTELHKNSPLIRYVDLGRLDLINSRILIHSVAIGLVAGWLGSLWIFLFCKIQKLKTKIPFFKNRYKWVLFVSLAISTMTFVLPTSYQGGKKLLGNLWYERILQKSEFGYAERTDYFFLLLLLTLFSRYFITLLFAASPVPNGVFLPSLIVGALFGR
jgi:H+/Cl- antiporter ClcA